jgi:hypothetical protein
MSSLCLLWIAVLWNRALWVNGWVNDLPYFGVCLVLFKELLPMCDTLLKTGQRGTVSGSPMHGKPTFNSASVNPRKSCVRCVLKHPVPNDLAASTPALQEVVINKVPRSKALVSAYMVW